MSAPTTPRPATPPAMPSPTPPGGDTTETRRPATVHPEPTPLAPAGAATPRPAAGDSMPTDATPGGDNKTRPQARTFAAPMMGSPGGDDDTQPTNLVAAPEAHSSAGASTRQATSSSMPKLRTPAGDSTHPTMHVAIPTGTSSGGTNPIGRHGKADAHVTAAANGQLMNRHGDLDAHQPNAVGSGAGPGQAAIEVPTPTTASLLDPALALAADVLDDTERVLIANQNRLRQLTRSAEDKDGEVRGLGLDERHPDVARLAAIVDMLDKVNRDATKNLEKHMRRHPLHAWAKSMRGVGDKQIARLLAVVGDPYIRPKIVRDDGTVLPAGPRTVSALWAYCGLHVLSANGHGAHDAQPLLAAGRDKAPADQEVSSIQGQSVGGNGGDPGQKPSDAQPSTAGVAARRVRGQKANWSTKAKTRAYLIAESCLKQRVKPCHAAAFEGRWLAVHYDECRCSTFRVVYDQRRMHTATTHPDWPDGHSHSDALRVASKEILKDLWRAAKAYHDSLPPDRSTADVHLCRVGREHNQ